MDFLALSIDRDPRRGPLLTTTVRLRRWPAFLRRRAVATGRLACDAQVTHIINCAGDDVPNCWEPIGIRYLTYRWPEDNGAIFDNAGAVANEITAFIGEVLHAHESVLVHSWDGCSRACSAVAAYFIVKFRW